MAGVVTNDGFPEIILYNALCTMHAGETMHCKPCYNALQNRVVEFPNKSHLCIHNQLEAMYFVEVVVQPAILFSPKTKVAARKTAIYWTVRVHFGKFRWQSNGFYITSLVKESLEPHVAVISPICVRISNRFASLMQPDFAVHILLEEPRNIYQSCVLDLLLNCPSVWTRWRM